MLYVSTLLFIFYAAYGDKIYKYQLSQLWEAKGRDRIHLFPTMESSIYPVFIGLPSSGNSHIHLTYDDIYSKIVSLRKNGSEVSSVCSYDYLGNTFYILNAVSIDGHSETVLNMTMEELEEKADEMTNRRMKPSYICRGHHDRFHAVWHNTSSVRHFIIQAGSLADVLLKDIQQGERGYYPTCLQVYRTANGTNALIIWEKGYGMRYRIQYGQSLSGLLEEMTNSSLYPSTISVLSRLVKRKVHTTPPGFRNKLGAKPTIYIVWRGPEFSWYNKNIPISEIFDSFTHKKIEELKVIVEQHMRSLAVPSVSLAIYRQGKKVYSAGFGYSDLRSEMRATPHNSYRIASISKTITAMGIVELINEGKLSIESNVFGKKGILGIPIFDPWLQLVTISQLLEHSSGGWSHLDKIEFKRTDLNGTELMGFYINSFNPRAAPGQKHIYSNIGYALLGRIIEKVSKKTYEQYIQESILIPNGIKGFIGKPERVNKEVSYYSPDNANPYTYWMPYRLDSAAGWVMTAEQVAKVFFLLEREKYGRYLLMTKRSLVRHNYGRGLQLGEDGSLFHLGSLAGSEGIAYTKGTIQVAILTNVRGRQQNVQTAWMEQICRFIEENENKRRIHQTMK